MNFNLIRKLQCWIFCLLTFFSPFLSAQNILIQEDSIVFLDEARNRIIPVQIYKPSNENANEKVVIFSHGYGENKGGANKAYSYLTKNLAANGYFVASIQHELPTDSLLPMRGNLKEKRYSNWVRGVENIYFVLQELKKKYPALNFSKLALIGHSNGGDMSLLFAEKYPSLVKKVITLDNRRMKIPLLKEVEIYTLRSSDQLADEGVLPDDKNVQKFSIKIVKLENIKHNEMTNNATKKQRLEINQYLLEFLSEK